MKCRCAKSVGTFLLVPGNDRLVRCYECGREMPVGSPVRPRVRDPIDRGVLDREEFSVDEADLAPAFRRA